MRLFFALAVFSLAGLVSASVHGWAESRFKQTFKRAVTPDPPKVVPPKVEPPKIEPAKIAPPEKTQKAIDTAVEKNATKSLDDAAGKAASGKGGLPKVDIPNNVSPQARDKLLEAQEKIRRQGASNKSLNEIRAQNKAAEQQRMLEKQQQREKTPIVAGPRSERSGEFGKTFDAAAARKKEKLKDYFNRKSGRVGGQGTGGGGSNDGPEP